MRRRLITLGYSEYNVSLSLSTVLTVRSVWMSDYLCMKCVDE